MRRKTFRRDPDQPLRKVRPPQPTWRQVLAEPVEIDSLPFGACMARLIRLRYLEDDQGLPLIDPQHYHDLMSAIEDWHERYPQVKIPDSLRERVRAALWIAQGRVAEPEPVLPLDLEPVAFG